MSSGVRRVTQAYAPPAAPSPGRYAHVAEQEEMPGETLCLSAGEGKTPAALQLARDWLRDNRRGGDR